MASENGLLFTSLAAGLAQGIKEGLKIRREDDIRTREEALRLKQLDLEKEKNQSYLDLKQGMSDISNEQKAQSLRLQEMGLEQKKQQSAVAESGKNQREVMGNASRAAFGVAKEIDSLNEQRSQIQSRMLFSTEDEKANLKKDLSDIEGMIEEKRKQKDRLERISMGEKVNAVVAPAGPSPLASAFSDKISNAKSRDELSAIADEIKTSRLTGNEKRSVIQMLLDKSNEVK